MKSKPRRLPILLLGIILLLASIVPACSQPQEIPPQNWTVANETEFLAKCSAKVSKDYHKLTAWLLVG